MTTVEPLVLTHAEPTPREADYWPTPAWVTEALLSQYPPSTELPILEPACGDGAIARVLVGSGYRVHTMDIRRECADQVRAISRLHCTADFLSFGASSISGCDTIITNPPFSLAREFVRACLSLEPLYCALLLPASAICGTQEWRPVWREVGAPTGEVRLMKRPKFGAAFGLNGQDRQGCVWCVWECGKRPLDVRFA